MEGIDKLVERALEMRKQGLTEPEIQDELHLSPETVQWLLSGRVKSKKPPSDVYIGWRSIGVRSVRIAMLADIFVDIIDEEMNKRDISADAVLGLSTNGVPLAQSVATNLDTDFIVFTIGEDMESGKFSSNFAGIDGKNVIIVDDVISSGKTMETTIKMVKENGGKAVLGISLINKTKKDDIAGVPIRALIRTIVV